jgi:carbamoyltransferase
MREKHAYVLGINAYDHDVSACLLRDGAIAYAIGKERITRAKHDTGFFQEVIDYCLAAEGISLEDIDLVVRNCYVLPVEDLETRMVSQDVPGVMDDAERRQAAKHPLYLSHSNKILTVSHHLAHAYSAFAGCPFDRGVVMVVDGVGNYSADVSEPGQLTENVDPLAREAESYYRFEGSRLETLKKVWLKPTRGFLSDEFYYMPGLGALYSRVSSYVFADWNKCGEVMGLAPYGRPGAIEPLLDMNGDMRVPDWGVEFDKPWLVDREPNWEASASMRHWEDLAWRVQDDTEKVLLARAKWLRETTGESNLCMAGGVALNCVANGRIAREAGFDNIWIQPAAGDDGIAIGCAYYGHLAVQKNQRLFVMNDAYTGMPYKDEQVHAAADKTSVRLQAMSRRSDDICGETARLLAQGHVFGWFQGRSEFGPRALGNRSILADPRSAEMKDKLNRRVKHRQAFRPFAPVVLAERAHEIFESDGRESPFMLLAERVRPQWRDRIPAVVHVDGTARVQTLRQDQNERLYALLKEFDKITGVPLLLNTSFNVKGEPIVETPEDALQCFLTTGIDCLVLHDLLVTKKRAHRVLAPLIAVYSDVASLVRTTLEARN